MNKEDLKKKLKKKNDKLKEQIEENKLIIDALEQQTTL